MLAAAAVAQSIAALDMSVVNVALPTIRTALGFAPLDLSWVTRLGGSAKAAGLRAAAEFGQVVLAALPFGAGRAWHAICGRSWTARC